MKLTRAYLRKALIHTWDVAVISNDSADTQKMANRARKEFVDALVDALDKPKKRLKKSAARNTMRRLIRKKKAK